MNARRLGWVRTVRFALAVAMLGVMVGAAEEYMNGASSPEVFYQCPGLEDYVVAAEFFYECPGFEEYAIVGQTTPAAVAAPAAQQR